MLISYGHVLHALGRRYALLTQLPFGVFNRPFIIPNPSIIIEKGR